MSIVTLNDRLTKFLLVLAAGWAFMLTFFIVADIIGRSVFDSPVYGVREVVMNSIVMIVFLQAGYAIRSRSMLRADFLVQNFPPLFRRITLAISYLLGAAFFLMILPAISSTRYGQITIGRSKRKKSRSCSGRR